MRDVIAYPGAWRSDIFRNNPLESWEPERVCPYKEKAGSLDDESAGQVFLETTLRVRANRKRYVRIRKSRVTDNASVTERGVFAVSHAANDAKKKTGSFILIKRRTFESRIRGEAVPRRI